MARIGCALFIFNKTGFFTTVGCLEEVPHWNVNVKCSRYASEALRKKREDTHHTYIHGNICTYVCVYLLHFARSCLPAWATISIKVLYARVYVTRSMPVFASCMCVCVCVGETASKANMRIGHLAGGIFSFSLHTCALSLSLSQPVLTFDPCSSNSIRSTSFISHYIIYIYIHIYIVCYSFVFLFVLILSYAMPRLLPAAIVESKAPAHLAQNAVQTSATP